MIFIPLLVAPLQMLLQVVINKYLSRSYCLTVISETPLNINFPTSFAYLNPKNTDGLVELMLNLSEAGCSDYIVHLEDPRQFIDALETIARRGVMRRNDKKLVIIPASDVGNSNNIDVTEILSIKECSFYIHLLFIIPEKEFNSECSTFDLITHKFIGPDSESQLPVKLDSWYSCNNTFENNSNLFPHDINDLNGKTMKIATFTYKPFILLDLDTSVAPRGRDGIEIRIIDEFCRWINCTIEILREDSELWGQINKNQTGVGVIGSVFLGRSDIGIAALYSWYQEWKAMDFSDSIIKSSITCLTPAPRILGSWELPLLPFKLYIWIAVIIAFILTSIGLTIAQCRFSTNNFMIVFGIMIAQSQYIAPIWRIRSVIGWILVSSVILISAYGAGLSSTFTVPQYEPSIDTVSDLVDRRMDWAANHEAWSFSLIFSSEPLAKELIKQFRVYDFEELKTLSLSKKIAFGVEKLPAGTFAIGDYLTKEAVQDMHLMLEALYDGDCVAMLRKNSPYTEKLNQLIRRLHQSGLLLAWETQIALKYMDYKVQLAVKESHTSHDVGISQPLSMNRVEGIFMIYVIGTVFAILFFGLELLFFRRLP